MKEKKLEFGNNQVIGFWNGYAIVYSHEDEQLYCFESPELKDMIGTCVEIALLEDLPEMTEEEYKSLYERVGD